MYSFIKQIV